MLRTRPKAAENDIAAALPRTQAAKDTFYRHRS
jgi:hypothetical protein